MLKLPPLTVDGVTHGEAKQPIMLIADGEPSEYGTLEDAQRYLRYLQLNGKYPEELHLFSCVTGNWAEIPV